MAYEITEDVFHSLLRTATSVQEVAEILEQAAYGRKMLPEIEDMKLIADTLRRLLEDGKSNHASGHEGRAAWSGGLFRDGAESNARSGG